MQHFFDYFPEGPRKQPWGVHSTSFGTVTVPPGAKYPPARHPGSHLLTWDRGRILSEYQILFIHKGSGRFESKHTRQRRIKAGMAFILFPGVWHRYQPDLAEGWIESWIEVKGAFLDSLRRAKIIDPRHPVYPTHAGQEIEQIFYAAAALSRLKPPGFTVRLGLLAVQILALLRWSAKPQRVAMRRMDRLISESQELLAADPGMKLSAGEIAARLGVGYSYFRRRFKAQTGLSPKQYRIELRHHRVKSLLLNSSLTVKEISEQLGYSSPFHLSQEFSRIAGVSAQQWRKRIG